MGDYVRRMPGDHVGLVRNTSLLQRLHLDLPLLLLLLVIAGLGLVVLYSASGQQLSAVIRQGQYLLLACGVLLVAAQIGVQRYARWAPWMYLAAMLLLVGVVLFGVGAKGAQRWLSIAGFRFQPSEIMKLCMPLMVAWFLANRGLPPRFVLILGSLGIVLLPAALILIQPDLGTSLLIASSGLFVLFLAGLGWRYIVGAVLLLVLSAWPAWMYLLKDYQRQRILTLLDPEADKLGAGWNIIQSKTAIGSGGWEGKGWLQGTQSQLDFLPEGHTDFIIAVLAEEFGLRGVLILLGLYVLVLLRGFWIAANAPSTFGRLVAGSLTLTFFVYIFVNMGMVAGLLPVVGVPLPLVSAGGTSLVTLMAGFGVLMAVATEPRTVIPR